MGKLTISENEAKSAIVADRARRAVFRSNNEHDCAEKQCKWEKYLEGRENVHDNSRGVDLREELKQSKRNNKMAPRFVRPILLKLLGTSEKCRFAQKTIQFRT